MQAIPSFFAFNKNLMGYLKSLLDCDYIEYHKKGRYTYERKIEVGGL